MSNAGDSDDVAAYEGAARKLGVSIKVGFPVPCVAGADYASRLGFRGIYILRSQADQEHKLQDEKFKARRAMSE